MPYSKAHYFLLALLVITFLAFWNSYFSIFNAAPLAHHLHGITATVWILLLATQNWFIHNGKLSMHRKIGQLIFVMTPLLISAFALVIWNGATKSVALHPFYVQFGQALLAFDALLLLTTSLQVYLALKFRSSVRLHSALILGTLIGLLPPIVSRLVGKVFSGLAVESLETLYKFGYSLHIGMIVSLLVPVILYFSYRKQGWPWLFATAIIALGYLLYATLGQSSVWQSIVFSLTKIHPLIVYLFGFLLGIATCYFGWQHGKKLKT